MRNLFYYVNNRVLREQMIDDMRRAAARSDEEISRQRPQASGHTCVNAKSGQFRIKL